MKILISVDMEGIAGVTCWDDVDDAKPAYERFRKVMTDEVNAAVEGALEGGATDVLVNDSHDRMRNVLIEELHPKAELVSGYPKPLGMMCGVDASVDLAFLIGYHAKAGTPEAILDHTWSSSRVYALHINGQELGETGLCAALAGHFGVAVALVTGDRAVTEEAQALLGPDLQTVAVKDAYGRSSARCLSPREAHARVRTAAQAAVGGPWPKPLAIEPPIRVGIEFMTSLHAENAAVLPGAQRVSGRRVDWVGEDVTMAYRGMLAMLALASEN
jgi:D-amino peptidase